MAATTSLRAAMLLLFLGSSIPFAAAFSFAFKDVNETLTQCQSVEVIWQGGQPPFELLIIPSFDYPQNLTLPDSAWNAETEAGSWMWQVNYPAGVNLVAMMSDATADGSGGVTSLFKVQDGSQTCQMRSTDADFTFQLNSTYINQCEPIDISWSAHAVAPVKILGVIPHGQPFMMASSDSNSLLRWIPNMAEGTVFMFAAFDAGQHGTGGSSNIYTVSRGSAGCMDNSSPSSTAGTPVMTSGSSRRPANGTQTDSGGVKTVTAIATVYPTEASRKGIVGIVVAIVLTLLALQAALLWFCCRRQIAALISHRRDMRKRGIKNGEVDLAATRNDPHGMDMDMDLTPTYQSPSSDSLTVANGGLSVYGKNATRSRSRQDLATVDTGAANDPAHAISPFLDPSTTGRSGLPLLPSPNADPFWGAGPVSPTSGSHSGTAHALAPSSEYDDLGLMPPGPPRLRTDSFDSGLTFGQSGSRYGSQQDLLPPSGAFDGYESHSPLGSPVSPAGSFSGSGAGGSGRSSAAPGPGQLGGRPSKASLVAQIELEERTRHLAHQQAQARAQQQSLYSVGSGGGQHGSGHRSGPSSATGASTPARALSIAADDMLDAHIPASAPRGGFSRHTDAGPLVPRPRARGEDGQGEEEEVEELPPMYDAQWSTQQTPAGQGAGRRP